MTPYSRILGTTSLVVAIAGTLLLVGPQRPAAAQTSQIVYTVSGVVRVGMVGNEQVSGPDVLGLDGATVVQTCVIDAATPPGFTGPTGLGTTFSNYFGGTATLQITGSPGGARDGIYTDSCQIGVWDRPAGSNDALPGNSWNFGLPFPHEFTVPWPSLPGDTWTDSMPLPVFDSSEVESFVGNNKGGSQDVFLFVDGTGQASGVGDVSTSLVDRIRDLLDGLVTNPLSDAKDQKKMVKAIEHLRKGLDADLWLDDDTLTDKGKKFFDEAKKAAHELMKLKTVDLTTVVQNLVDVAAELSQAQLAAAVAGGGDAQEIEKAQREMAKVQGELDKGHFDHAIDKYKKAWEHARKALT